ncbi:MULTISPECIES: DNA (cytosine-5-)-methyltransferase [Bacillus cereus group]|uniref:DNA (cytosine-5-)-methyltransferase n=2 Tax=Bacteria TaxID=2 RepID=UPI0021CE590D|nr:MULTISPECIES: DNA (cytosine-5-)-methyltransferase [Bacillus cereus group]MCU5568167.1 DNA (cytosine-5-)-methyltransferase [Bacillus paranthracis]MDA2760955.1 DNA (cytosine-5-)-methyltransferase [Bacillus cereus group sp. Bc007]MDA2766613.1 DNA (cytosine-5-)-methyltransferase [Bacillus cereus group sp. Bc008]MDA2777747.1 DNA (cytosine-5-)-methyltransferase [Bacillus cereus group sp. Bc005]MDX5756533.1 DNA (cytosine-5-)-methyltransferase [Bacillus cereus group sp. BfR-BA-02679]
MNEIGIKQKRERLGITQKEFADALGLGKNGDRTLRRWENGESVPSPLELKAIMDFPEDPPFLPPNDPHFTMIDLFAGIGGIRLAFQKQGGLSVFASEWDKFAAKTYKMNYGHAPEGDITQIPTDEIPEHNILLAGFPCQPFSQAGLKKGFEDTRGTLFFDIARILETKKPQAFLLENVKQLRGHNKGKTLETILRVLREDLNYTVDYKVLRAADFGIPQNRERIYIVGFYNPLGGKDIPFDFPNPTGKPTKVGDILEKKVDEKYTISDKLYQGHLRRKEEHKKKGNGFGFSLFNENSSHTNTISARYYKDGSEILIDQGEGKNPRKLTPRECARLQGFPEEFVIPVSDTQAYRQFGNSVAVPVVEAISKNMVEAIEKSVGFKYASEHKQEIVYS